ncbi:hypothetical protein SFC43_13435 [Bacteroides sp. CR5/BHMF/2]|nr:hypothetical protein [Bacteroides sp. CR5/BHMF/2]
MAELRILDFNGTQVSFVVGGRTVLVCVSELSKSLTKAQQPSRWLATKQAKRAYQADFPNEADTGGNTCKRTSRRRYKWNVDVC